MSGYCLFWRYLLISSAVRKIGFGGLAWRWIKFRRRVIQLSRCDIVMNYRRGWWSDRVEAADFIARKAVNGITTRYQFMRCRSV